MPCRAAISSHSLGRAWVHDLPSKLDQAARFALDIELFYEDLEYFAQTLPGVSTSERHLEAARLIRSMCDERGISIVCLQPFMHYEGLRDRQHHSRRVEEMKSWIAIARKLRTSIIAIPSSFLPENEVSGDIHLIIQDMREVADLASVHGIQIAYEALAWGTYVDTWEQAWEVVEWVNRENFGICLDTFNLAALVYADPTSPSRKNPDAENAMKASLERMVRRIDPKKILFVQVVDAEYLHEPLLEHHPFFEPGQHPRMSWSRNCRLFYGEEERGGYLPIRAVLKAILRDIWFEGWISAELFNISLTDPDPLVPEQHAQRAAKAFDKMARDLGITFQSRSVTTMCSSIASRAQL